MFAWGWLQSRWAFLIYGGSLSGQIVAYVRVSSADQNPDRQLAAVGEVERVFQDESARCLPWSGEEADRGRYCGCASFGQ